MRIFKSFLNLFKKQTNEDKNKLRKKSSPKTQTSYPKQLSEAERNKKYSVSSFCSKNFKNSYSIADFETLAAQWCYQEAYWASLILEKAGVRLNPHINENVRLTVEYHWEEIFEDIIEKKKLLQKKIEIMKIKMEEKEVEQEAAEWIKKSSFSVES